MTLSPDGQVLCFDGAIAKNFDVSRAKDLKEDGLFVVRSGGGDVASAIVLAELIRDRRATVVVHDYCLSACASVLLIAPSQTYVLKGALVAWHQPRSNDASYPFCTNLVSRERGPKRLERGPCLDPKFGDGAAYRLDVPVLRHFLGERAVDPSSYADPPDSIHVRRIVTSMYEETGAYRDVMWTLNPRYYASLFKTKIVYEAYPESQDEVDGMLTLLGRNIRVIYDP
jgi:hypothetical protein